MNQEKETDHKAGALILSRLRMFNEATVYFEKIIDNTFWKSFDQFIERFIKENNWAGKAEHETQDYCWLAHPDWIIEGEDCKYWFEYVSTVKNDDDYLLAVLTGTGTEQGQYGFQFKLNAGCFGGMRKLAAYASSLPSELCNHLVQQGFIDQGKGNYFLPVILDSAQLAECWQEYGSFPLENELFTPLRDVLEKLLQSAALLDSMFSAGADTRL